MPGPCDPAECRAVADEAHATAVEQALVDPCGGARGENLRFPHVLGTNGPSLSHLHVAQRGERLKAVGEADEQTIDSSPMLPPRVTAVAHW